MDSPISGQDQQRYYSDLIRLNQELSRERDALVQRNRELEAGFSDMKRDLQVSRDRMEVEKKEKSRLVSTIAESLQSLQDRLLKSMDENAPEGKEVETEESVLEEVEVKLETLMESMEKKLSRSLELLKEENRDITILLRAALSEKQTAEKQLKETNEQKKSALVEMAERGLQRIGFGFGFKGSVVESSEMGEEEEEEDEENSVVIAIEKTMKNLRTEISQLKLSLEESRFEQERLKKITEEQAQKLEEKTICIDEMQIRESFLTQNVEELVKSIREGESEISRWREACELEVEAGQREITERNQLIAIFKAEVEKMRSALAISEGKLKLKEELARAAMVAEEAAEKSLRLAERRIAELLSRIEQLYRQLEEADSTERRRGKFSREASPRSMEEERKAALKKIASSCDVEALKKCLEENKGDHSKCRSQVEAFRSSCSLPQPIRKP